MTTQNNGVDIRLNIPVTSNIYNAPDDTMFFCGIGLTNNPILPTTTLVKTFTDAESVGLFFGTNSNEYIRAVKYFTSVQGLPYKPPRLYFGKWINNALSPYLRSLKITTPNQKLLDLQAVTAGAITFKINGINYPTPNINLSTATSISNAMSLLTTAIKTANSTIPVSFVVTYNNDVFDASISTTGSSATMDYPTSTTDLATLLGLTQATGAILSQGSDALTPTANLDLLSGEFGDQFSLSFVDDLNGDLDDVINLEVAKWVSDYENQSIAYFCSTDDSSIVLENDTTSIDYLIKQAGYNNTSIFACDPNLVTLDNVFNIAFCAMGVFASVDLSLANSAISLAWKQQTGLQPTVANTQIAKVLQAKNVNYYQATKMAGTQTPTDLAFNQFNFFQTGGIIGKWYFIDNLFAQVYISGQVQKNLTNLFIRQPEIVNNPDGDSLIRSTLSGVMENASTSKLITSGNAFSNTTAQYIKTTFGADANELTLNGYIIGNNLSTEMQRQYRTSAPWYILYVKASAINILPINTTTFY